MMMMVTPCHDSMQREESSTQSVPGTGRHRNESLVIDRSRCHRQEENLAFKLETGLVVGTLKNGTASFLMLDVRLFILFFLLSITGQPDYLAHQLDYTSTLFLLDATLLS